MPALAIAGKFARRALNIGIKMPLGIVLLMLISYW